MCLLKGLLWLWSSWCQGCRILLKDWKIKSGNRRHFQKRFRILQRRLWLCYKRWFICVKRSNLQEVWMTGWHDLVSIRVFENVMGKVGRNASCSAVEKVEMACWDCDVSSDGGVKYIYTKIYLVVQQKKVEVACRGCVVWSGGGVECSYMKTYEQ